MQISLRARVLGGGAAAVLLAAALFVTQSYRNPPLIWGGGVTGVRGKAGDEIAVGWDLGNRGWFPVRITEVTIEGYEGLAPLRVVGAIGPSATMVGSSMPPVPEEQGYILQTLGAFSVPPARNLPAWEIPSQTAVTYRAPRHYGLIISYRFREEGRYDPVARTFTVRYRYLGLPMALHQSLE